MTDLRFYRGTAWRPNGEDTREFTRKDLQLVGRYDDDGLGVARDLSNGQWIVDLGSWDRSPQQKEQT